MTGHTGDVLTADDDRSIVRRTQALDIARSIPLGIFIPLHTSVLLTILVKHFDAPSSTKGLIASASGIGLLMSPFITSVARRSGRPVMRLAALLALCCGVAMGIAAGGPMWLFLIGAMLSAVAFDSLLPLTTVTLRRNYPNDELGRRVGISMTIKVLVSIAAAWLFGRLLDRDIDNWRTVVVIGACAGVGVAICHALMPSSPIERVEGVRNRPWPHFHLLSVDRQLRLTLIAWMFMGFGNLMLLPLRVEYLDNPRYGIEASAGRIVMLTVTVPSICKLIVMPMFGWVFDRLSFFASRIAVNLFFGISIASFFTGSGEIALYIGAVLLGVAMGGGDLMWNLWVTKFAPEDRIADYMGLHTFFTGMRACSAPLLAFAVVDHVSLPTIAWTATALIAVSAAILLPEARQERAARRAIA